MELLLAETIAVAQKSGAVSEREIERVTIDTTVATKAIAPPTDNSTRAEDHRGTA
ncbi:MAG: hypothetical protein HC900_03190 [Methylacidiphilales bacterium]|nr:hypothetical protein [Candidatus Methylacidiphilales bacterium]